MIKRILLLLLIALFGLAGFLLFNTLRFASKQVTVESIPAPEIQPEAMHHFQQAIRFKTISHSDSTKFDSIAFRTFQQFLQNAYPLVHKTLSREVIAGFSLIYTWEGKNQALKPVILMAHQDVVPIEEVTRNMWTVDPFEGVMKDQYIWGRGTADDKINLISIFEATEKLLKEGFRPERTVYLVFGHNEEVGGRGAIAAAALFKSRNIQAELILDEGGIITKEKMPGITRPVALLGTAEKGYLTLILTVKKNGGHSSMPATETAIDILSKGLVRLRQKPLEARFSEPVKGLIEAVGPEMPFFKKVVFANAWLFRRALVGVYEKSDPGNAMIRTTIVPTTLKSGIKDNVIPTQATATVNCRLLPGDLSSDLIGRIKQIMNDDRIEIEIYRTAFGEATAVTPTSGRAYQMVSLAARKSIPESIISPFLMIGATDSRHFSDVSQGIIKFSPMIDPIGFHGIDERVSLESFKTSLWFFEQLMRGA